MRAASLTAFNQAIEIVDLEIPACPDDGAIIQVLACGVCRSDYHGFVGADPDIRLPHILGHEFCGEIVEIGKAVKSWRRGQKVIAPFVLGCGRCVDCRSGKSTICRDQAVPGFTYDGAFAEYVAVPFADFNLAALPENLPPKLAAAMGCRVTTSWQALTARAEIRLGEWVVVLGMGGVGLSTQILAQALGGRVIAIDIVYEKLDFAKSLGAELTIHGHDHEAIAKIKEVTNGGADIAIEALGIEQTARLGLQALRKFGRYVQIGMPTEKNCNMSLPMDALYSGQLTMMGTRSMPAWRYPDLLALVSAGKIDLSPLLQREIGLGDASAALMRFAGAAPAGIEVITDFGA